MTEETTARLTRSLSGRVLERDEAAELWLSGEFDFESTSVVEVQILNVLSGRSRVVVDLSDVTFMDSAAIGVLVRTKQACDAQAAELAVRLGGSPARRVLDLAGLSEFLGVQY